MKHHKTESIYKDTSREILVKTYFERGMISTSIWQICELINGNEQILFTVESSFQEADPVYPKVEIKEAKIRIVDEPDSYLYLLEQNKFEKNNFPSLVYLGKYKNKSN